MYTPTNKPPDWTTYLLTNNPSLLTYSNPYLSQFYTILTYVRTYLGLLISRVSTNPDLATIALLLIILFVSLKILDILWQSFLFWLRLARKVVFWGGLAALGVWMYTRGPEGMVEDVGYWTAVWSDEYGYWRERERVARMGAKGWAGGGASYGGYGGAGRGRKGWY